MSEEIGTYDIGGRKATNTKTGEEFTLHQLSNRCKSQFNRKDVQAMLEFMLYKVEDCYYIECKKAIEDFLGVNLQMSEREIRRKNLNDALAISSLGGSEPTDFAKELFEKYVDGEVTVEEGIKILTEKYKVVK